MIQRRCGEYGKHRCTEDRDTGDALRVAAAGRERDQHDKAYDAKTMIDAGCDFLERSIRWSHVVSGR